jgi:hypothetical protein
VSNSAIVIALIVFSFISEQYFVLTYHLRAKEPVITIADEMSLEADDGGEAKRS